MHIQTPCAMLSKKVDVYIQYICVCTYMYTLGLKGLQKKRSFKISEILVGNLCFLPKGRILVILCKGLCFEMIPDGYSLHVECMLPFQEILAQQPALAAPADDGVRAS